MNLMDLFAEDPIMKNGYIITDAVMNDKSYNGTTDKFGITVCSKDYIVKFSKDDELTVFTEYIASNFIQHLGYSCHTVYIGKYKDEFTDGFEDVSIMLDFTENFQELHSYKDTKQSSEDTDIADKHYTYDDVIYMINKHSKLNADNKVRCIRQFWEMYVCDAILGNRDRHWGNWGYLINNGVYEPAPMYDNGSSLFPGVGKVIDSFPSLDFMKDRVYTFPASLLQIKKPDRTYRTNYREIIATTQNEILIDVIEKLKLKFSWQKIMQIAFSIVNDLAVEPRIKEFWVEIIVMRFRCIICKESIELLYDEVRDYYAEICKVTV